MKLVNLSLYAEAYYSGRTYEENRWVTQETYEKIKEDIPEEIFCGELDGKHSQVFGDILSQPYDEELLLGCSDLNSPVDGDKLEYELEDIFEKYNIDYDQEQLKIEEYLESLDSMVEVTVCVRKSKKDELLAFAKTLK